MGDRDARLKEILERFDDVPVNQEPAVQQLKKMLEDFLENGPGTLEERQQADRQASRDGLVVWGVPEQEALIKLR
jgi:hypothetical protein